jgi:hypothetical protein
MWVLAEQKIYALLSKVFRDHQWSSLDNWDERRD